MSNPTVRHFTPYINKLRNDAERLRQESRLLDDELTAQMHLNSLAQRLEEIANDIEDLADATQYL